MRACPRGACRAPTVKSLCPPKPESVSYTHLDVYKRQRWVRSPAYPTGSLVRVRASGTCKRLRMLCIGLHEPAIASVSDRV